MLTQRDCSVTRISHSGAWEVAAMVNGYRVAKVFYGYTAREALRLFVSEINLSQLGQK